MYSSSSSDESFLHLGMVPDTMDPFSRFWGMLDNMLVDISNPVAFASAPIGPQAGQASSIPGPSQGKRKTKAYSSDTTASKDGKSALLRSSSPSDSFYVVPKAKPSSSAITSQRGTPTPSGKTPEELTLENENLRLSLDAIAQHAQSLEQANQKLKEQFEERDKMLRSVATGMRREVSDMIWPHTFVHLAQIHAHP